MTSPSRDLTPPGEAQDLRWKEYEVLTNLYTFYLDQLTKGLLAYFAIAGGILTFTFANFRESEETALALLAPIVVGFALGLGLLFAVPLANEHAARVRELRDEMEIGVAPHVHLLAQLVSLAAAGILVASAVQSALLVLLLT